MKRIVIHMVFAGLLLSAVADGRAQEKVEQFSQKGIKVSVSSGSYNVIPERNLKEGEGGMLSVGYGFTERFSLWVSLFGAEHLRSDGSPVPVEFGGIELNLQHKFSVDSRLQPYGKVGFGVYGLGEKDAAETLIGAGINVALGVDYFFAKHFGVGLEVMAKKLDYFQKTRKTPIGDLVTDLDPNLNGDTSALMLTFTVQ